MNNYKLLLKEPKLIDLANDLMNFTHQITIVDNTQDLTHDTYLELNDFGLSIVNLAIGRLSIRDIYSDMRFIKPQHNELLIEAIKSRPPLTVLDLTAGLGKDSLIMANYGYQVTMVERNPILATILYYAITYKIIPSKNLTLIFADAIELLMNNQQIKSDIVYLDPMFNASNKSLAKKDMQLIQVLTKDESDNIHAVFNVARLAARKSIVVKRDDKQQTLFNNHKVSYTKSGKTIKYDIYAI